jgi:glyoxylase-like metal-dependent hydrolase (beta-lactamase superfamily II)
MWKEGIWMDLKILIEGYAKEVDGNEFASSTTVLIIEDDKKIIIDPGTNREELLNKLEDEGLKVEDIDYVILTHGHFDHSLLTGIFSNARVIDNESIYSWDSKIVSYDDILGENIKILPTPGHDPFHLSVLLTNTKKGNIIVAGDVFWWWDSETQVTDRKSLLEKEDPYVKNAEELLNSRKLLLELGDYIIPGHGKPFVNE